MTVASVINGFPTLCPDLVCVILKGIPGDPVIIDTVSEMLLACNRDFLQVFEADTPLTEEAREVVYQLPRLTDLWVVIKGTTSLPSVTLPNLITIYVEFEDLDRLRGFRGAKLNKLEWAAFHSNSDLSDDFLEEFERVALAASAQNTLSTFKYYTSRSWDPNYRSLLPFKQLKKLEIQFSCGGGCSSRVDDDIIINLGQAMPKLEVLRLGGAPCRTATGYGRWTDRSRFSLLQWQPLRASYPFSNKQLGRRGDTDCS